ncbi:virulence factor MviN [Salmonella enterica subsp. salamae]|uniref:Virulence factor MviN n=1 Tax=Salmonella enterica subsp. salamae TaxID=59202 RepID=A0A6D2G988_SALER|nr:virulence factor MviN [Salmonella enterica subsp. salamae]
MQEFYARVWNTKEMNLLKSLAAVSSMTMFSRVLGFARDAIVARIFGAGMATDAFFVAFKLPNLLRRIFAEGAFSQAFVPILAEYKSKQGEEATRIFVAYVSGLLTLALAVVTVAGMLAAPWVIMVTAPGFADTADKFALTTQLLRITFPYILLISLASLVGAILNTWNRFSIPAFAPTFLNISMIGFALFAAPYFNPPVLALAWAVTVGGVLQLVYQLPYLKKIGMLVLPRINFRDTGAMRGGQTDGAGDFGRFCQSDFPYHQYDFRLVSGLRFGLMDVLCRSVDGVPVRRAGRGVGGPSCCRHCQKALPAAIMMSTAA